MAPRRKKAKLELSKDARRIQQLEQELVAKNSLLAERNAQLDEKDGLLNEQNEKFQDTISLLQDVFVGFGSIDETSAFRTIYPEPLEDDVAPLLQFLWELDPEFTRTVCRLGLERNAFEWEYLPFDLQTDYEFGRIVITIGEYDLPCDVFETLPDLRHERDVWNAMIACGNTSIRGIIENHAPAEILADRLVMTEAIKEDAQVLSLVSPNLKADFDFVTSCIECNIVSLADIPGTFAEQYPEYVKSKLIDFSTQARGHPYTHWCGRLADKLCEQLKRRPGFFTAWFDACLPILENAVFDPWRNDRELFLQIAAWRTWPFRHGSFQNIGVALKDDADFMIRAVGLDPFLYKFASDKVKRQSFELAMVYLASGGKGRDQNRDYYLFRGKKELAQYRTFMNPFLCGLKYPGTTDRLANVFSALNQCDGLKSLIAEFVGVPRGELLRNIQSAVRHNP